MWTVWYPVTAMGEVEKCICTMQKGTQMIKLKGKSKTLVRVYNLDEHRSCIRWRPSRKNVKAKITIDSIHKVCEGKNTEVFQHFSGSHFDPNCCLSIYHGIHMESLDLVTTNAEEAHIFSLTLCKWLRQTFSEADRNGSGKLSIREVLQLLHKLNVKLPRQKVMEMFKEAETNHNQGSLKFEDFYTLYKMISARQELQLIMLTFSHYKDHMDIYDLIGFLESEQKMVNVSREYCQMIVNHFEARPENQVQMVLGIDGKT
ncbi:hypothetical protein PHYPO_G00113790 [Pangasianodon hypophthalmus]|uniref:EF-hand domain-containing protein n=1 Tax=Pangasianodon hypophthalmus TaxID=310915 RepID=A0A5N5L308_PANHP|nr:hypothetical protein PHYPO_G00113790 [Pangasianodon hypophthalmus]